MRVAWLECATGVSGDMTLAALIDAGVDRNAIETAIQSLKLPDVRLRVETVVKGGFRSTQVFVDHPKQHAHRHMSDIRGILDQSDLTDRQRQIADRLFLTIAQAEACVHGSTVEKVHFHEVAVPAVTYSDLNNFPNHCYSPPFGEITHFVKFLQNKLFLGIPSGTRVFHK